MSNIRAIIERLYDLSDPFDPVDEPAIKAFEADIGTRLPEDYREFLLLHNGGRLHINTSLGDLYRLPSSGLAWKGCMAWGTNRGLIICEAGGKRCAISFQTNGSCSAMAQIWLHYCLSLRSGDYGTVWVFDREQLDEMPFNELVTNLRWTFSEFLRQLQPSAHWLRLQAPDAAVSQEPLRSILLYDLPSLKRHLDAGGAADCRDQHQLTPVILRR